MEFCLLLFAGSLVVVFIKGLRRSAVENVGQRTDRTHTHESTNVEMVAHSENVLEIFSIRSFSFRLPCKKFFPLDIDADQVTSVQIG